MLDRRRQLKPALNGHFQLGFVEIFLDFVLTA